MSRKAKRRKHHQDAKRRRTARRGTPQKVALRNGAPQKGLARNGTTRNGVAPRHSPNGERRNQLSIVASSDRHLFPAAGLAPGGLHGSSLRLGPIPVASQATSSRILDLDELAVGDELATYEPDLREGLYREIHFGELLNFTRDPLLVLRRAREWLAPSGAITATFANVRHAAIVASLLAGEWRPSAVTGPSSLVIGNDEGQTTDVNPQSAVRNPQSSCPSPLTPHDSPLTNPVRFYTRREIEKLFYRAGYVLRELRAEQNPDLERWRSESRPAEIVTGSLRISAQSPDEAEEFITERYQAVAVPDERRGDAEMGRRGENAELGTRSAEQEASALTPNRDASKAIDLVAEYDAIANCKMQNANCKLSEDQLTREATGSPGGGSRSFLTDHGPLTTHHSSLTSIVIVTFNQLAFTRMCLESIRFRTDEPYELIVVDNGSTDGTVEYLRSAADVKLIENAENRGFPAAANQGILANHGQQILLLNNDVIVTTGWLRRMLDALDGDSVAAVVNSVPGVLESTERGGRIAERSENPQSAIQNPKSPKVGLVGPCSNCVSGSQQVPVSYDDLASLDGFAWDWGRRHHAQRDEVERLVGFCLLFRRELVDRVGVFDERFGVGNFEDDDFCLRARQAGYRVAIARDAFIHHFGHRTFAGAGIDLNALMEHNARLYQEKWKDAVIRPSSLVIGDGHAEQMRNDQGQLTNSNPQSEIQNPQSSSLPSSPHPVLPSSCPSLPSSDPSFSSSLSSHPSPPTPHPSPTLSCCMIVRNNETTIAAAVTSILPWVGEVIVVDTGSTDRTAEICRQLGCKVFHFPWPDSFSAARNESLKYATGEWIFWMDSDDVIDAENGRKLSELVRQPIDPKVLGLTMQVHCPAADCDGEFDATVVDHCKVFRNRPDIRFEGRIHEQVLGAIGRAGGDVAFTPLFVVHANADHTPAGRRRKLARDFKLLRLELKEQPGHTFTLFNLGMTFADANKHRKAVRALERSLAAAQEGDSHVRKIYALLVSSLKELGRAEEAGRCCQQALTLFPKDPELHFRWAIFSHEAGRLRLAEKAYLAALANDDALHFASLDRGITGYKARQNLALVYADMGAPHKAEEQWLRITREVPDYREGWRGLFDNLLEQRKLAEAQRLATELAGIPRHASLGLSLASELAEIGGQFFMARQLLDEARRAAPGDPLPLQALTRLLFQYGDPAEARARLMELVNLEPTDAAAYHNLGTVCLRMAQPAQAAQAFWASLQHRPNSPLTQLCLGYALREIGRLDEAASTWRACLRQAPEGPLAAEAQRQLQTLPYDGERGA